MVAGVDPTQITKNIADQAQQGQDFWQKQLGNGNFDAPLKQTPQASDFYQPAAGGTNDFLTTQAKALGGLVGPGYGAASSGGGVNPQPAISRSTGAFDIGQNRAQNGMDMADLFKNIGTVDANANNRFGTGNEIYGATQALDQTKQTAQINAIMERYQQQIAEEEKQAQENAAMTQGLFGAAGNLGGGLLADAFKPNEWTQFMNQANPSDLTSYLPGYQVDSSNLPPMPTGY